MDVLIGALLLVVGLLAGVLLGVRLAARGDDERPALEAAEGQALVRDGLDRLHQRMADLEHQKVAWQSRLDEQVEQVRASTDLLRRETGTLATALRRPAVRGQWGELHLRRSVELAGMVEHCDFDEQVHQGRSDGAQRPDLVVHLAGGRSIVVDAKVPLEAYLDALSADDSDQGELLSRHARQLRHHVSALSAKAYWRALPDSPEFVVLFVPAESCLSAALGADPGLLQYAAAHDVVLASPTTLIALLRTVAHGWTTERLAEATREIHELGRELHDRLATMGGHLDKLGRSLTGAVDAYNRAVGSLESRVLVTARQFDDIGVSGEPLASPTVVGTAPRPLTAPELLEAVAEHRPELPEPAPGPAEPAREQDRTAG